MKTSTSFRFFLLKTVLRTDDRKGKLFRFEQSLKSEEENQRWRKQQWWDSRLISLPAVVRLQIVGQYAECCWRVRGLGSITVQSEVVRKMAARGRRRRRVVRSERRVVLSWGGVGGGADGVSVPSGSDNLMLNRVEGKEEDENRGNRRVLMMVVVHWLNSFCFLFTVTSRIWCPLMGSNYSRWYEAGMIRKLFQ